MHFCDICNVNTFSSRRWGMHPHPSLDPSQRSARPSVCPSVRPTVCLPVHPSVLPSVRSSVRPSAVSVRQSVRPSRSFTLMASTIFVVTIFLKRIIIFVLAVENFTIFLAISTICIPMKLSAPSINPIRQTIRQMPAASALNKIIILVL